MSQSAWGPPEPEPEDKGPEPGTYLRVPIIPVVDDAAMRELHERLKRVARDALVEALAEAIGELAPPPVNVNVHVPPPAPDVAEDLRLAARTAQPAQFR